MSARVALWKTLRAWEPFVCQTRSQSRAPRGEPMACTSAACAINVIMFVNKCMDALEICWQRESPRQSPPVRTLPSLCSSTMQKRPSRAQRQQPRIPGIFCWKPQMNVWRHASRYWGHAGQGQGQGQAGIGTGTGRAGTGTGRDCDKQERHSDMQGQGQRHAGTATCRAGTVTCKGLPSCPCTQPGTRRLAANCT
eukprot:358130-Chlamydomonas_euryale.AAC.6